MGVAETLNVHGRRAQPGRAGADARRIGRQTRLLDNITADLLAAGQAQHGTLAVQIEKVDPTELVRAVVDDGFDLTLVKDSRPLVLTDPMRFQQMLGNLLSNARKYGEPPFVVRVTSAGQPGLDRPSRTAGRASPRRFRPRLFQEYSRAPGTSAGALVSACSWCAPWPRPRAEASPMPHATRRARCSRSLPAVAAVNRLTA